MNFKVKHIHRVIFSLALFLFICNKTIACSIVYYVDSTSGKIYVANNEDYWYSEEAYIQLMPAKKNENARLWYGWDDFAQGGVNAAGLFFDAAVTPEQKIPEGFTNPNGRNIGDEILANCQTVDEAIAYLEQAKIAISTGHFFLGDSTGNAAVLEWVNGEKHIVRIENNVLIATNYLLIDTSAGNYPCYRYQSIEERINDLKKSEEPVDFRSFANVIAGAVQTPTKDENGQEGGTLYSTFIDMKEMKFVLVPKLDNSRVMILDLNEEFQRKRKKKIKF